MSGIKDCADQSRFTSQGDAPDLPKSLPKQSFSLLRSFPQIPLALDLLSDRPSDLTVPSNMHEKRRRSDLQDHFGRKMEFLSMASTRFPFDSYQRKSLPIFDNSAC